MIKSSIAFKYNMGDLGNQRLKSWCDFQKEIFSVQTKDGLWKLAQ